MSVRRRRNPFDWSTAIIVTVSGVSALTVYLREGADRFYTILGSDLLLFGNMMPKMLAGCLIGGFVTLLLPREVVARLVGAEFRPAWAVHRDRASGPCCRAGRSPSIP